MTPTTPQKANSASDPAAAPKRDALASLRIERPDPTTAPKSHRRWILLVAVLLIIGGGVWGYRWSVARGWTPPGWLGGTSNWVPDIIQNRMEVRLSSITVQTGRSADAVVVATGYLESRRQAKIGARAPGRIEVIHVEEGSRVKEGELMAVLEHADLDASLAAMDATVAHAKAALAEQEITIEQSAREMTRADSLWKQKSISESEHDQARFSYQSAVARKASLAADLALATARQREAQQLKENMFIRAPFDGTVISKDAEVGESILPGGMGEASGRGSVATIADLEHLEVECDVKEDFITRVHESQLAEISVDAVPGKKYHGTVRKIIPMGDRARATIKVQVEIVDADQFLFPDMSGTVYFLPIEDSSPSSDDRPRMFCPASAVTTESGGDTFVWLVDAEGHAQKMPVSTGESRDGATEIIAGLTGNERVIANPEQLRDGELVKVLQ